ncbi:MAG: energy-coupling factor transporter transmembrane component T family protein [Methanoculleaceae archaeon]
MTDILQYTHSESLFHRLHPLTKLTFLGCVIFISILSTDLLVLGAVILLVLISATVSGLSRDIAKTMKFLLFMALVLTMMTILTIPEGEVVGYLIPSAITGSGGPAGPVTTGGILTGLILSMRFTAMILAFQMVIISTQPSDLVRALRLLRMPADYALMILIAVRFIPTIQMEAAHIHEAQLSRGYDPGRGISGCIRSIPPLVVPLVSSSLSRATVIGLTIDLRGYRRPSPQKDIRSLPFTTADRCFICIILSLAGFLAAATAGLFVPLN